MSCWKCIVVVLKVRVLSVFFFKQKTAYEMRISDWSSDVCSSDLQAEHLLGLEVERAGLVGLRVQRKKPPHHLIVLAQDALVHPLPECGELGQTIAHAAPPSNGSSPPLRSRSEEHTSELQSLMRISYAVFCLKKKHKKPTTY